MNSADLDHLRPAFALARAARELGNHPFGALLADEAVVGLGVPAAI